MSSRTLTLILVAALACACMQSEPPPPAPAITAQGFDITEPRAALVGEFGDVRLRLETPGKIDELRISERTFSTDLAKTMDKGLFGLFGLDQRPYSRSDVTLDFSRYINEKITAAGAYQIDIMVTDHIGQSATESVFLDVRTVDEPEHELPTPAAEPDAETADFSFERVGPGDLSGANVFGITWKTVDPIQVTVQVAAAADGATKIARLDAADFRDVQTQSQLAEIVDRCTANEVIEFDTANAAAAGQVFAVINGEQRYILQASASETQLTEAGTTVVVTGRYKY